jgi:ubiquinone/menaquinone biosynthesis C-methylase UbiE
MNTIYFWKDTRKGMSEVYRVLKPGGVFYNAVITKENLDSIFYTKSGFKKFKNEEYIEIGRNVGFTNVVIKPLGHGYGLLIIYRK